MRPFSIRLFAPAGEPEGVLVASRDDWPGRAVIFPRELVGEVRGRKEYSQPGVYILVGAQKMYIGEGDPVGERIDTHDRNKGFWRRGVFFTAEGGRLNKAHVQHLESRLIALARDAGRVAMDNRNQPAVPALSEEDHALAESFLHQMLLTLPLLGFRQFAADEDDQAAEQDGADPGEGDAVAESSAGKRAELYSSLKRGLEFRLNYKGACATLETVENGVQVKQGSTVVEPPSTRFEVDAASYAALRRQLVDSGVIALVQGKMVFTQDQFFSAGSPAASVVRGAVSNADWWKGSDGKSLGDHLRAQRAKQ